VQHRDGEDERAVEPVRDVDVFLGPLGDRAEEHDGIADPHHRNDQVNGPLQLRVLLAGGDPERQGNRGQDDDELPAPKGKCRKGPEGEAHAAGALHHVVGSCKKCAPAEGENHGVGMQRPQPAECQPGDIEVEIRPGHLGGDEHPNQHAHHAPDDGHDGKLLDDLIVVALRGNVHASLSRCIGISP
jgi:23S rRNA (cytosine1962-C5)-methyltransferase